MGDRSVAEVVAMLDGRITYRMFDYYVRSGAITLAKDGAGPGTSRRVSPVEVAALRDVLDAKEHADAILVAVRNGELFADRLAHHQRLETLRSGPGHDGDEYADTARPLRIVQ